MADGVGSRLGGQRDDHVWARLSRLNWPLLVLVLMVCGVGAAVLFSAADGHWQPWAAPQLIRAGLGVALMFFIGLVRLEVWWRFAYPIFLVSLMFLVAVELAGVGDGAERWINLGFINLQPSELVKVAVVVALARYFHDVDSNQVNRMVVLLLPGLIIAIPVVLVLRQPDLGTALIICVLGVVCVFLGGLAWWKFGLAGLAAGGIAPLAWAMLHDYQRDRILTFMEPERDPLGAGYHIVQSKIALGSGGVLGKGYMEGSQSQLSFLPEKHTDFVFTLMAEEFGLFGSIFVLGIYALIIGLCFATALRTQTVFAKILVLGLSFNFFLFAFINMAMVMGLLPVVGVPLPLISYGGTAMLTLMIGFGFIQSAAVHADEPIGAGR
jgi:rod shape determining protein RodA